MKKILYVLSLLSLTACVGGGKSGGGESPSSTSLSVDTITDSVCFKLKGQDVCSKATVLFPTNNENIQKGVTAVLRQLGQEDEFSGYPDTLKVDTNDIRFLVRFLVENKATWLKTDVEDLTGDLTTPLSYSLEMKFLEETDNYVTLGFSEESCFSGPHPLYSFLGVSYLKPEGKKLDASAFISDKTDDIRKAVQSSLKKYISDLTNGEDVDVDAALNLKNEDGSERLVEFPEHGFYLMNDSVVFTYHTDEIASYAFGMPVAALSLKEMKSNGWLGKELSDIVK